MSNAPAPARPRSRWGRAVVITAFTLVVGWSLGSVLGSVVVELYGGPPTFGTGPATQAERSWCGRRLRALRDGLEARVVYEAGRVKVAPGDAVERWRTWSQTWESELQQTAAVCRQRVPESAEPFTRLAQMHQSYQSGAESILAARTTLGAHLDAAIEAIAVGRPAPN